MVGAQHRPIHNAYNLLDRRATKVAWLRAHVGEERIVQLTGNRITTTTSAGQPAVGAAPPADDYRRIWKALTIDGFITLKLTGQAVVNNGGAAFMASPSTCRRTASAQPCWRPSAWRPIFCRQFTG